MPRPGAFPPPALSIVHATDRFVVVEKPAWMLSVPGKGPEKADCVAARVKARFPMASGPLVVHRLDMETSGLIVLGLDEAAQRDLSGQFENRVVEKAYIALLGAQLAPREDPLDGESGTVRLPIRPDIENRPVQIVDPIHGRESETRWRVIGREVDRVRVRFEPITGRTHQIRVHASWPEGGLGRPIIGDALYGGEPAGRLMLHAAYLSFLDPASGRRVEFESRAPF